MQIQFLTDVCNANQPKGLSLQLDFTSRLVELHLKFGHYSEAEHLICDTDKLIPCSPDPSDQDFCQSLLNFLIMKIDILMVRQKFSDANLTFVKLMKIISHLKIVPEHRINMLSSSNWASFLLIKGIQLLEAKKFEAAKHYLHKSFIEYDKLSDKKITNTIPYYWLASILSEDEEDVSLQPEFSRYLNHPIVSIMKKISFFYNHRNCEELQSLEKMYSAIFYCQFRPIYSQFFDVILHICQSKKVA